MRKNSLRHSAMRFSLLLSAFLLLAAGTLPAMRADAASVGSIDIKYNDAKFDVWCRVSSKEEVTNTTGDVLLISSDKKHATAFINSDMLDEDYIYMTDLSTYNNTSSGGKYNPDIYTYCIKDYLNDSEFFTPQYAIGGTMYMSSNGTDSDNSNQPRKLIEVAGKILMGDADYLSDCEFEYSDSYDDLGWGDDYNWTVMTPDKQGGGYSATSANFVSFVCNIEADDDVYIKDCGSQLEPAYCTKGSVSEWRMYKRWSMKVPAITKDLTVTAGNTVSLSAGAVLADGVTLTIEPGAVVSVESTFYNNGIIENYGTLLVSDGGQIRQIGTTYTDAGTIRCYGGGYKIKSAATGTNLSGEGVFAIMKKGGAFFRHNLGSLYLYGGSVLQNYGTVELPDGCVIKESEFINAGTVTTGIKTATVSPTGNSKKSYINCDGGESFIENQGSWNNYSVFVDSGNSHISNVSGSNSGSEHGYGGSGKGEDVITTTTTKTTYIYPEYTVPTPPNGYNGGGVIDDVLR